MATIVQNQNITPGPPAVPAAPYPGPSRPEPPPLPETIPSPQVTINTSWENPFEAGLWNSTGWRFTSAGMETLGKESSSATFVRPYQRMMMECDLLSDAASDGTWEFRVTGSNAARMGFVVHSDRMSVMAVEHGATRLVIEKPLATRLSSEIPRQFRIVATGNRIVISWDGRRFLMMEELAALSGQNVEWSMHTKGATYRIPRLRVEGD